MEKSTSIAGLMRALNPQSAQEATAPVAKTPSRLRDIAITAANEAPFHQQAENEPPKIDISTKNDQSLHTSLLNMIKTITALEHNKNPARSPDIPIVAGFLKQLEPIDHVYIPGSLVRIGLMKGRHYAPLAMESLLTIYERTKNGTFKNVNSEDTLVHTSFLIPGIIEKGAFSFEKGLTQETPKALSLLARFNAHAQSPNINQEICAVFDALFLEHPEKLKSDLLKRFRADKRIFKKNPEAAERTTETISTLIDALHEVGRLKIMEPRLISGAINMLTDVRGKAPAPATAAAIEHRP